MLKYLLENHIYFFYYLDPHEVNKLISISKCYPQYITNNKWKEIFIINNKIERIIEFPTSINIIYNKNHITSLEKKINTKNKHIFQYIVLSNNKELL